MSLYYTLEIAAKVEPTKIADLLEVNAGFKRDSEVDLQAEGVTVGIALQDKDNQEIMIEEYGFCPNLNIVFHFVPSNEVSKRNIAIATALVLKLDKGDAMLFYNGEIPVLRRSGQHLVVKEGWGEWLMPYLDSAEVVLEQSSLLRPAA
jgi:hypothetical protein